MHSEEDRDSAHLHMIVVGTRPEIIKMAPVIKVLQKQRMPFVLVHTAQHYDYNLSLQFFQELELPKPDYNLKIGSATHAEQTAKAMVAIEKTIMKEKPEAILIEGDTNTTLAAGLAAIKLHTPIGHVESGLRSYDLRMPEEHNRRIVDHISTYLFAPTKKAATVLQEENVWGRIFITGNTVIDACMQHVPIAERKSKIMNKIKYRDFALITAHRAENVDSPENLEKLIEVFLSLPIASVFPVHPRTKNRLMKTKLWKKLSSSENTQILPPVGYLDFLLLMKASTIILTDSGGIQEEATSPNIRKQVLVLRKSTERPEAVEAGFAKVVGLDPKNVLQEVEIALKRKKDLPKASPFGDGNAGERIGEIMRKATGMDR